ncbi:MAG TPA: nodulation protein NfeD [Candidatus Polarisedimenticolia bacterium]|nr:nodulation protein NfeD [Candidatus Polarisedimenticolia bacterium]
MDLRKRNSLPWIASLAFASLLWSIQASSSRAGRGSASAPEVFDLELFEAIQPITAEYVVEALKAAERRGASLVILELDTPGGLVSSTQIIVKAITQSPVPVVVYVSGAHAASAGFFITLAADVAVMAPGTRFGAAHPVGIGGSSGKDGDADTMARKVESDLAAWVRTLAQNRRRNVSLAEEAVRQSRAFTEKEALKGGLIDFVLPDAGAIVEALDGKAIRRFTGDEITLKLKGARVERMRMSARERFLSLIADPQYVVFLLILGVLGLYLEFTHPGLIFPGVLGALFLLCFAYAVQILPINYAGLLLILLSMVLFVLELKITSHGILTVGAIAALVLGSLLLFRRPEAAGLSVPLGSVMAFALGAGLIMAFLTQRVLWAHRQKVVTGGEGLVGAVGEVVTPLNPSGRVFVHGETWNATSSAPVLQGRQVKVLRVQGMMLDVEEVGK